MEERAGRRALIAAIMGNALEWYDFIVYGFLAAFIAKQFFPPGDESAALLGSFAAFALPFLVRPIAGVLIGYVGDRRGRRTALLLVMAMMTLAMVIMVLVPPYASIGIWATVLLVVARLIQSASAGGEFGSAATYLLESVRPAERGLYSGLYSAGPAMATVLSALMGLLITQGMSAEVRDAWGWRLPFVFGLLIAPVALYVRRHLPETGVIERQAQTRKIPVWTLLGRHLGPVLVGTSIASVASAAAYTFQAYAPTYVVTTLKLPGHVPFLGLLVSGLLGTVLNPLFGRLADYLGARTQHMIGLALIAVSSGPLYAWLNASPSLERLIAVLVASAIALSLVSSVYPQLIARLYPSTIRSTGMSLSYNLSATVFGGSSLFTLTYLIAKTGSPLVPAYYVVTLAVVCLLLMATVYRRLGTHLT